MAMDDSARWLSPELHCVAARERLHAYLEGETDPITSRSIKEHLGGCAGCADEARRLEEERIEFFEAALVSPEQSPRFPARVVEEIRRRESEARGRRKLSRLRSLFVASGVAAAIALAAAGIFLKTPSAAPDRGAPGLLSRLAPVRCEMSLIENKVRPEDRSKHQGPERTSPLASCDGEIPSSPAVLRLDLPDWIEFSARFFPLDERRPCQRDFNQDGQTDVSDAAHLFMLALAQEPADLNPGSSSDDLDLECTSPCQI